MKKKRQSGLPDSKKFKVGLKLFIRSLYLENVQYITVKGEFQLLTDKVLQKGQMVTLEATVHEKLFFRLIPLLIGRRIFSITFLIESLKGSCDC